MSLKLRLVLVPVLCAGVVHAAQASDAKPGYRLVNDSAVGDRLIKASEFNWAVTASYRYPVPYFPVELEITGDGEDRSRIEVLAVDRHSPTAVRRHYERIRVSLDPGAGESKSRAFSVQGKTVRLVREKDKVKVTASGKISAFERQILERADLGLGSGLLPKTDQKVSIGERWSVPAGSGTSGTIFTTMRHSAIQCELVDVVQQNGLLCAKTWFTTTLKGTLPGLEGAVSTISLEGHTYQALAEQRTVLTEVTGTLKTNRVLVKKGKQKHTFFATGTVQGRDSHTWLALGGKPVEPPQQSEFRILNGLQRLASGLPESSESIMPREPDTVERDR